MAAGRRRYDGAKLITNWWAIIWPILAVIVTGAFTWGTTTAAISKVQSEVIENKKEVVDLRAEVKVKSESRDKDIDDIKKRISWMSGKMGYPEP